MNDDPRLIETEDSLRELIEALAPIETLAVDTEFLWERTYLPKLALVQVAGRSAKGEVIGFAVDPLAVDPMPLLEFLKDPKRLKIMHAGRLDQQIMNHELGAPLTPVFDSQRAAALLGFGGQIGYANLVEVVLGEKLKKTEQYTDWTRRPLRETQIVYALADVTHLVEVYERLREQLLEGGRLAWAEEEMAWLSDPETYVDPPASELYLKIKRHRTLDRRGLAILRELASWRDQEARRRDRRPRFIAKDTTLLEIAARPPKTTKALKDVRGLHPNEIRHNGEALLKCVTRAMKLSQDELPAAARKAKKPRNVDAAVDLLRAFLAKRSTEVGVASETLVTTSELERLARDSTRERFKRDHPVLNGWRGGTFIALVSTAPRRVNSSRCSL